MYHCFSTIFVQVSSPVSGANGFSFTSWLHSKKNLAAQEGGETIFPKHRSCQEFGFTGRLGDSWRMLGPFYDRIGYWWREMLIFVYSPKMLFWKFLKTCKIMERSGATNPKKRERLQVVTPSTWWWGYTLSSIRGVYFLNIDATWINVYLSHLDRWLESWDSSKYNHTGVDGIWNIIDYHQKEIDSKTWNYIHHILSTPG